MSGLTTDRRAMPMKNLMPRTAEEPDMANFVYQPTNQTKPTKLSKERRTYDYRKNKPTMLSPRSATTMARPIGAPERSRPDDNDTTKPTRYFGETQPTTAMPPSVAR